MKDYYNSEVDFIENYRITKNKEIHVRYGDNHTWIIPYTKENEETIKFKMLNQAKIISNKKDLYKKRKNKYFAYSSLGLLGVGLLNFYLNRKFPFDLTKFVFINIPLTAVYLPVISKHIKSKIQLKEAKKVSIFLEHEREINERGKTNPNILGSSAKKIKGPDLTINNYDLLSLNELRNIRNNLLRDKHLKVDYKVKEKTLKFR